MSDSVFVGTQIDPSVRDVAVRALDMSGLSLSDAIHLMIAKTARDNRLPFDAGNHRESGTGRGNILRQGCGRPFQAVGDIDAQFHFYRSISP